MEPIITEQRKIRQIAEEYQKQGYVVKIEPQGTDIPNFIRNYQPDLIATSDKDNVIIEVKSRAKFSTIESLRDIVDDINKRDNWRFELIVIGSRQDNSSETEELNVDLNVMEITENLTQVKSLIEQKQYSAAFIFCWANLESLSRQLILEDKRKLNNKTPLALIKTLFSFGYLTRLEYENLERLFQVRNQLVHGYKSNELNKINVKKLASITEQLLKEKINISKNSDNAIS